ncbi:haloacid dehalogenase type II [Paraburkholderia sp. C35]|uniref:haloacid dehalogenase type II n=1 Tax=Paraburkholderia sp. C35 TaxID=2126993 RepID=UPI000D68DE0C|nr:haloacid dehalogenase type II [Paraburkholderia sp. C35]
MQQIKAIAFDLYGTLFDVHSVATQCDIAFPGRGKEISQMWRQKQLEYSWLRSLMNDYVDFHKLTMDALLYTTRSLGLAMSEELHKELSSTYLKLDYFPEVPNALRTLRNRNVKLAILSNGSPDSIKSVISNAGLIEKFDYLLSVDPARIFKPHDSAYNIAEEALNLHRSEILFVSSNAWDATGARHFGFPTCWINRTAKVFEEMGQTPDWEVKGIDGVVQLLERA